MIYLVTLSLLLVLAANYSISRNMLYPPCVYTAVWLISLLGLIVAGDTYYPVATEALLVYLVGAVAFSVGGVVMLAGMPATTPARFGPARIVQTRRVLDLALLCVVIGLPFYMWNIMGTVEVLDVRLLAKLRRAAVEQSASSERAFGVLKNLVVLAQFVAMAMHYENNGTRARRWRSYAAVLVALAYGILTGSKGPAITLIISLMFISFMRRGAVNVFGLAWVVSLVLVFFGGGVLLVTYVGIDAGSSLETLKIVGDTVQLYWLSGLVAFNHIVQMPDSIESSHHLGRFFLETANGFGARFDIPSIHAEFSPVSPVLETNIYTIYFSYFKDYGWLGLMFGMSALGAVLSAVYRRALGGGPIAVILFSALATGIVFSFNGEHFVLRLNFYIKMLIFLYLVYYVLGRLSLHNPVTQHGRVEHA